MFENEILKYVIDVIE